MYQTRKPTFSPLASRHFYSAYIHCQRDYSRFLLWVSGSQTRTSFKCLGKAQTYSSGKTKFVEKPDLRESQISPSIRVFKIPPAQQSLTAHFLSNQLFWWLPRCLNTFPAEEIHPPLTSFDWQGPGTKTQTLFTITSKFFRCVPLDAQVDSSFRRPPFYA